jgi:hypothetical protein
VSSWEPTSAKLRCACELDQARHQHRAAGVDHRHRPPARQGASAGEYLGDARAVDPHRARERLASVPSRIRAFVMRRLVMGGF